MPFPDFPHSLFFLALKIANFYTTGENENQTVAERLTRLGTHIVFRCPTRAAARALASAGVSTYLYLFDFHIPNDYHDPTSAYCQGGKRGIPVEYCAALTQFFISYQCLLAKWPK